MLKCTSADRYTATFPPRCNGGKACDTCIRKWQEMQASRIVKANRGTRHEAAMCAKYGEGQ